MKILDIILQIWMLTCMIPALFMIPSSNNKVSKKGYFLALLSQPAYLLTACFPTFKFGLFVLSIIFTIGWAQGYYRKRRI